jgi:hypothetical protein
MLCGPTNDTYKYMITQGRHMLYKIVHETYNHIVTQETHKLYKIYHEMRKHMVTRYTKLPIWYNITLYVTPHLYISKN